MALATQCPHCQTTFRVAHDQLKLRAGLVRCGACKQIFNGVENLLRPEDAGQISAPSPRPAASMPPIPDGTGTASSTPSSPVPRSPDTDAALTTPPAATPVADVTPATHAPAPVAEEPSTAPAPRPVERSASADGFQASDSPRPDDPLLRMTLLDIAPSRRSLQDDLPSSDAGNADTDDSVERAIDDLQSKPWRRTDAALADNEADPLDQADDAGFEEPSFVRQGRRRQRLGRTFGILITIGSLILLLGLFAQATYLLRDQIAVRFPDSRPTLVKACAYLGCRVSLPAHIDLVSIESSELQTLAPDSQTFVLTVLLRNQSTTPEAWPHLEMTLNDAAETPLLRRVFAPQDYLGDTQRLHDGLAARSEQAIKLYFELDQLKASGYRVYVFYP